MSDSKAEPVTVLLVMDPRMAIPGTARLRIVVWDEHGTQLSQAPEFHVVWRAVIRSAQLVRDPEGRDVIEVVTDVMLETRQYYAIIDGDAALVRLEGHQRRNGYIYTTSTIGPPVAVTDRATCLATRGSTDPFVVLELLMWLTADHGPPEIIDLPPGYLEPEAIRLHVGQLLTDPEVIAALRHVLQTFKHPWVRDAAHEALRLGVELTW